MVASLFLWGRKTEEFVLYYYRDEYERIKAVEDLYRLVSQFRTAIETALENEAFSFRDRFHRFPRGCCDDACDLLGQYLSEYGIDTRQFQGTYRDGGFENITGHAWLLLEDGTIIDITGDQFKNDPVFLRFNEEVYIGPEIAFHRLFEQNRICDNCSVYNTPRLCVLYQTIKQYL